MLEDALRLEPEGIGMTKLEDDLSTLGKVNRAKAHLNKFLLPEESTDDIRDLAARMSAETRCNDDAALRMEAQNNARLAPVRLNIPEVNAGTKVSADPALQTDNQLMAFLRRRDADVVEIDNLSNAIIYICEDMTKVPVTMQWAVTLAGAS